MPTSLNPTTTFFILCCILIGCNTPEDSTSKKLELVKETRHNKSHPYGGWSCPDNILGFPALSLEEAQKVIAIEGRLPTKEETQDGRSLIFIDTGRYENAKALDLDLPRVATYYSTYTKKDELVLVIQAVVVEEDTIVGFRNLNGGNGSSWLDEIRFLTDSELKELEIGSFVSDKIDINANGDVIWKIITGKAHPIVLGGKYGEGAYIESNWQPNEKIEVKYSPGITAIYGLVTASWINRYLQIDYELKDVNRVEKFLLREGPTKGTTEFHIVSGPYTSDLEQQKKEKRKWLMKLKVLSELIEEPSFLEVGQD